MGKKSNNTEMVPRKVKREWENADRPYWVLLDVDCILKRDRKNSGKIVKLFGNEWMEFYTICAPKNNKKNVLATGISLYSVYWITLCFVHIACSHNLTNGRKEHVTQIRANELERRRQ